MKSTKRLGLRTKSLEHETAASLSMPAMSNKAHPSSSPFLQLAAELRSLIYYEVLAPEDGIIEVTKSGIQPRTAILRTSRQIRDEATNVLLRSFRFRIECGLGKGAPAVRWLESLGTKTQRIRSYEIAFDGASALRYHFASSLRHALLEYFASHLARRVRSRAYKKSLDVFVADYIPVFGYLQRHIQPPRDTGRMVWQFCAPSQRVHLRSDEVWYMTKIETILQDGGFAQ